MSALGAGANRQRRRMRGDMATSGNRLSTTIEVVLARAVMIGGAAGIAFVGFTLLTTPLAIPVTVGLWLGAITILGLGLFGELPRDV
jgi:hypothetical protein